MKVCADPQVVQLFVDWGYPASSPADIGLLEFMCVLVYAVPRTTALGAVLLTKLDEQITQDGVSYVRYMDDILVMATTRWKLKRAIAVVKHGLAQLGLRTHPDKTWVGKTDQGFDFLAYHLGSERVIVAKGTVKRCVTRIRRLHEQEQGRPSRSSSLGVYVSRWWRWADGGLPDLGPVTSPLVPPTGA